MGRRMLADQLHAFDRSLDQRMSVADRTILSGTWQELRDGGALDRVLQPGAMAPPFTLPDQNGVPVRLADRLQHGPVVLLFIRGCWCPFCTLTLRAWQDALPQLHDAGGDLLAVLPQGGERCIHTAERDLLAYPVLSDRDSAVGSTYGLTTMLPVQARPLYTRLGHDLQRMNADGSWRLSLMGTFVIEPGGRIIVADASLKPQLWLEPDAAIKAVQDVAHVLDGADARD